MSNVIFLHQPHVPRVPKTAEGTLGLYVIDFGFEREVPVSGGDRTLKSGIKVSDDPQPHAKKSKVDEIHESSGQGGKESAGGGQSTHKQYSGKQVQNYWSAPPKLDSGSHEKTKFMADAQKAYRCHKGDNDNEKVHIPDTLESSESDSESFTIKVQKLTGIDDGQSKCTEKGQSSNQVWFVNDSIMDINPNVVTKELTSGFSLPDKAMEISQSQDFYNKNTTGKSDCTVVGDAALQSPEIFIPDDTIINTQESMGADLVIDNNVPENMMVDGDKDGAPGIQNAGVFHPEERRRSERLKKDTNLHCMDKAEKVAKKINLEGNSSNTNSFSVLPVEEIVDISANMGIAIRDDDFTTFDLLKTLESARNDLYFKENETKQTSQTESVESSPKQDELLQLEWLHEETSETEDFILVESRKKRRQNKKNIKISPLNKKKQQDQENPGLPRKRGRPPKSKPPINQKEKKK